MNIGAAMRRLAAAVLAAMALVGAASAQPFRTEHVETQLHAARAAIAPGERFAVVVRQTLAPGWHSYWINPGAAGEPTELAWRLPPGFSAGPIRWPTPKVINVADLVNYGYSGEVLLPVEITAPAALAPGQTVSLDLHASWVVCSDICVFEEGELTLQLPVAATPRDDPRWGPRIARALAELPTPFDASGAITARVTVGDPPRLSIAFPGAVLRDPYFFAYSREAVDPSAPQNPSFGTAGASFDLPGGVDKNIGGARLDGVLAFTDERGARRAYEIVAEPGEPLPDTSGAPPPAATQVDAVGLLLLLALAFVGGLILNLMPCVLPVLSMKALAFAGGAHVVEARRHGAFYFIGVVASFLALAGLLLALRGAGEAVGWGFQLQAPALNAGLALLFFAIGLNLLGAFEIAGGFQGWGDKLTRGGGDLGAFFTGVLAVLVGAPCIGPVVAGAMGAALTLAPLQVLLFFAVLAIGFALPLTALSFAPALQRLIPRPGPWMERFKQVLAFPMFAAAIWLAWVLTQQTGAGGALGLLALATALSFVLLVSGWGRVWLVVGLAAFVLTAALTWRPLVGAEREVVLPAEPWSPARVEALRAEGRGVFVNFTAAWCITCKVNELAALSRPRVEAAFERSGTAFLKADWTNRDETIAAALAAHGRAGVPLYLYYRPGAREPVVLPQLLNESLVIDLLEGGSP